MSRRSNEESFKPFANRTSDILFMFFGGFFVSIMCSLLVFLVGYLIENL